MIDAEQMKTIISENNGPLYKYCRRILGDRDAAQDVTNEVWLVVIRKRSKLSPGDSIRAYIYRVADKCIMRWRREYAGRANAEKPLDDAFGTPFAASDEYFSNGMTDDELLGQVMKKLSGESKELFRLRFIEKKKLEEIADITGTPYSTLWLRLEDVKAQAAKIIESGDYYE